MLRRREPGTPGAVVQSERDAADVSRMGQSRLEQCRGPAQTGFLARSSDEESVPVGYQHHGLPTDGMRFDQLGKHEPCGIEVVSPRRYPHTRVRSLELVLADL